MGAASAGCHACCHLQRLEPCCVLKCCVNCRRKNMQQTGKPPSNRYNRSSSDSDDGGRGNGRQPRGRQQDRPQQQRPPQPPPPPLQVCTWAYVSIGPLLGVESIVPAPCQLPARMLMRRVIGMDVLPRDTQPRLLGCRLGQSPRGHPPQPSRSRKRPRISLPDDCQPCSTPRMLCQTYFTVDHSPLFV